MKTLTVIVFGDGRGRVRSADSARRQAGAAVDVVSIDASDATSLNGAARSSRADVLVFVDAGYELLRDACATLADACGSGAALAAGAISVESDDARNTARWTPSGATLLEALARPRDAPPVFAVRRDALEQAGGFDEALEGFETADLIVRLFVRDLRVAILPDVIARYPASRPTRWLRHLEEGTAAASLERFLRRHEPLVQAHARELMLDREIAYAVLRDQHAALMARRDASLSELDALRAESAHAHAFLAHHGLDGVDPGDFARTDPIDRDWGYARGGPVDRVYIERFLASHSSDIHGAVLEVQEDDFTRRFGGPRVTASDVLDLEPADGRVTVVADLRGAPSIPSGRYDCIILTQTAHVIDAADAVMRECHRLLAPGGVLLATLPCASRVCLEYGPDGDFHRVTPAGAERLVRTAFSGELDVETFGNVFAQTAFAYGLGAPELTSAQLDPVDPYNPVLVGVRARRPPAAAVRPRRHRGLVLLYHRVDDDPVDQWDLNVPSDLFASQLDALTSGFTVMPLRQLLDSAPEDLPERPVALTFDDGYRGHLALASTLAARGVPATFFVTGAVLQPSAEHWWDQLDRLAWTAGDAARRDLHDRLVHAASAAERARLLADARSGIASSGDVRAVLSVADLRTLAAVPGMDIGAHGAEHLFLPGLGDEAVGREMDEGRRTLEQALERRVDLFAYPYGGCDDRVAGHARQRFAYSMACDAAVMGTSFDAARVPRVDVKRWSARDLTTRLDALFDPPDDRPAISFLP